MPGYLRSFLALIGARLEELAPAAAQKNINLEILRKIKLPVPPLELQRTFENRLEQFIAFSNELEIREKMLGTLGESMAAQAF